MHRIVEASVRSSIWEVGREIVDFPVPWFELCTGARIADNGCYLEKEVEIGVDRENAEFCESSSISRP